jgi:hypothetical protein
MSRQLKEYVFSLSQNMPGGRWECRFNAQEISQRERGGPGSMSWRKSLKDRQRKTNSTGRWKYHWKMVVFL